MNQPIFSIILVNWNTARLLVAAVDSIVRDSIRCKIDVEIIVVDNGSSDDSRERLLSTYPEIPFLENGQNLGFSRAINRGLDLCRGQYIMLLNTDASLEPGCLDAFLRAFEKNPQMGILGAHLLDEDGSPQNSFAPFPSLVTELLNKSALRIFYPSAYRTKVKTSEPDILVVDSIIGACLVVRRTLLDALGPLDTTFFFFFEETDWCYRASNLGWMVGVVPDAKVVHGQGKSSEKVLVESRIEYYRSRYRYFRKHFGQFKTTVLLIGLIIKLISECFLSALGVLVTLGFSPYLRQRLVVVTILLFWHLKGCPLSEGLEGMFLYGPAAIQPSANNVLRDSAASQPSISSRSG